MTEKKKDGAVKKSAMLSGVVFLGKVLGLVKQSVIAVTFGATSSTDVYFSADSYVAFFGQVQGQAIAPAVLTRYIKLLESDKNCADNLISCSYTFFVGMGLLLSGINIALAGSISAIIGVAYGLEQKRLLILFIRLLCPIIAITAFTSVTQGVLESNNVFVPSKLISLFFSFSIIVFAVTLGRRIGVIALLLGYMVAYVIHAIYMGIKVKKYVSIRLCNPFQSEEFRSVLKQFFPLVVGNSIVDIGNLVDKAIAATLAVGSVSVLYYGQIISIDLVNGIFITSVGSVLLPQITKMFASGVSKNNIISMVEKMVGIMFFLINGIIALYFVEGEELIKMFFERGSFNQDMTHKVAIIAMCYVIGLGFAGCREVIVKIFYALQDTYSPMVNASLGVVINVLASILFSQVLGVYGIALATSISSIAVTVMQVMALNKKLGEFPIRRHCLIGMVKTMIALLVSIYFGKFTKQFLADTNYVFRMCVISFVTVVCYICVGLLLKHDALKQMQVLLTKRFN